MSNDLAEKRPTIPRWGLHALMLAGVLLLLYYSRAILPPFVLGLIIAYILDPFLDRLQSRGWSRDRAIRMVFLLAFLTLILLALLIGPPLVRQATKLFTDHIPAWASYVSQHMPETLDRWNQQLAGRFPELAERLAEEELQAQIEATLASWAQKLPGLLQRMVAVIGGFLWGKAGTLLMLLLTPIAAYYFMQEIDPMKERVLSWFPQESRAGLLETSKEINDMLAGYFRGELMLIAGVFIATLALLHLGNAVFHLGMQYLLLIALAYGVLYVIPIVGATLATILGATLAYFTSGHTWQAPLVVVIVMVGLNVVFDNLVSPRVVGRRVGVHPLVVLFAVLAGAQLMGILGMIVAVPFAAMAKILINRYVPEVLKELQSRRAVRVEVTGDATQGQRKNGETTGP